MKLHSIQMAAVCLLLPIFQTSASVFYVDVNNPNPAFPYAGWDTAATNIQDAIDASSDGDQIWVTNGIYQTGGRVMAGDLTNRVALNKAVTVQSVNGPWVTIIQGSHTVNGTAAVRCAWLTNNAALIGFTLKWGATQTSGDASGGGVWCASSNATVANCVIAFNTAFQLGGGAYQGMLENCLICSNSTIGPGGGACNAILLNCTVISNANFGIYQTAPNLVHVTNCIIYFNPNGNYGGPPIALSYCCTTPAATGTGNLTNAPQLFVDGVHLTSTSPCIGAGTSVATATDIFGKAWANPPAVGCAEFDPSPFVTSPQIQLTSDPVGFTVGSVAIAGQPQFTCWWIENGVPLQDNGHFSSTQTTNLVATGVSFADAGSYQLVVSNAVGVVTSAVAQLVVHCVDVVGTNPVVPYLTWATAATNIQDAITASAAGDIVLVTNGLYATGGKSMDGLITNRVSVDKAIIVQGVTGPNATIIQGAWDPTSTNGPGAVRCAWLTTNATLSGFTLRGGATLASGGGGGVFAFITNKSPSATVANCVVTHNTAGYYGGGAYGVWLNNCVITTNSASAAAGGAGGGAYGCSLKNCVVTANVSTSAGGGVDNCNLQNCAVTGNTSIYYGGGAYSSTLINCTLTGNRVGGSGIGGGVAYSTLTNCIVYANFAGSNSSTNNSLSCTFSYSDTDPLPSGAGNMDVDPQLLADSVHLTATSPCLGAGNASVVTGTDIDGQPWDNPPAIGCDEWQPAPVVAVQPGFQINSPAHGLTFNVVVAGQSPFSFFWSKDGAPIQDDGHYSSSGTANLVVNHFGPDDAGHYQVVVTNAFGTVTSAVAQAVIHAVDAAGINPVPPYSTWATAATNIQDAVTASGVGDIVLVTNGVYSTGGKVMAGDLTNRVVLDKAVFVSSVNGFAGTVIQGAWDPASTNGPGAVRCAWLSDGAVLNGFTLRNGATRATGDPYSGGPLESGGGVWCTSTNGVVSDCVLTNNVAIYGGGIGYGTLNNSLVAYNAAIYGGGAYYATLNNCTVVNNYGTTPIIGVSGYGGGTCDCIVHNSIVINNYDGWFYPVGIDNYYYDISYSSARYSYSCTWPLVSGTGNLNGNNASPQFLDLFHIASTSPYRGMGSALYTSETDLDDELWANPPSMGCDEVVVSNLVGPLSVNLLASQTNLLVSAPNLFPPSHTGLFQGIITGRASSIAWSFGDGMTITNSSATKAYYWTNTGDYAVTFTAYNNDNPGGVSTNIVVHVLLPDVPQLQSPILLTNGFQFQFPGQSNANYTIQYTTNLTPPVAWQTLQTIYYNYQDVIQVNDPAWTNTARFYRVLAQ